MSPAQMERNIARGGERAALLMRVGQPVVVLRDDGETLHTVTKSLPWQLGHGAWVIKVGDISGGYDILRVEPAREVCRKCGCMEHNCQQCVEKTGVPCHWADESHTLCTACVEVAL